ncbi:MAG: hypothetical protein R6U98_37555 [Pirellulaceae bacterium]
MEILILCGITGVCVTVAALAGQRGFSSLIDEVERDLRDRLRWLRVKANHPRAWIHVWLGLLVALFLAVWLVTNAPLLALSVVVVLIAGPWYLIRRTAKPQAVSAAAKISKSGSQPRLQTF